MIKKKKVTSIYDLYGHEKGKPHWDYQLRGVEASSWIDAKKIAAKYSKRADVVVTKITKRR